MNPIKILDKTLKSLKDHTSESPLPKEVVFLNAKILENLTNRDKRLIVDKLIKDGYAERMICENLDNYYITFDGLLFIENGGYKKEKKNKFLDKCIKVVAFFLLVVTSVSGVYYSYHEIFKKDSAQKTETLECKKIVHKK